MKNSFKELVVHVSITNKKRKLNYRILNNIHITNQNLVMQTSHEPIALDHLNILFKNHLYHEDDVFRM